MSQILQEFYNKNAEKLNAKKQTVKTFDSKDISMFNILHVYTEQPHEIRFKTIGVVRGLRKTT